MTTIPAALASAVVVTCDGSTTSPTAIVSYDVVAELSGNPNFADTQVDDLLVIGQPVANVTVSKTADQTTVRAGMMLTWTIVVENDGPSSADVKLLDALPSAVENANWTCIALGGATCGTPSGTGDINFTSTIPAGGTVVAVVSATVSISASDGTMIENTAMVEWQSDGVTETAMDSASAEVVAVGIFSDGFEEAAPPRQSLKQLARDGQVTSASQTAALGVTALGRPAVAMELLGSSGEVAAWLDHLTVGKTQLIRLHTLDAQADITRHRIAPAVATFALNLPHARGTSVQ